MNAVHTIIIGAGQAGLAMSQCLGRRGIEHVVLERGTIAHRWRFERWPSLRLLTPNWMSRLPGWTYRGEDPDGYMTMPEIVRYLEGYAASFAAPVLGNTTVTAVNRVVSGYEIDTSAGLFLARNVVVATGACNHVRIPTMAGELGGGIVQLASSAYRRPDHLADGGVLIVGASATGVQLAEEIHHSGRPVTLSAGRHLRMPRRYRGRDIFWWLDSTGLLDQRAEDVADLARSRAQPSLQLAGRPNHSEIDLGTLRRLGVRVLGRCCAMTDRQAHFRGDLAETTSAAAARLARLLDLIDSHAKRTGIMDEAESVPPVVLDAPETTLDLAAEKIRTVIWATGYARDYSWLNVPVLDAAGEIRHLGGITSAPGLYVLGLNFLRRRKSNYIDGVGHDAEALASHIEARSAAPPASAGLSRLAAGMN